MGGVELNEDDWKQIIGEVDQNSDGKVTNKFLKEKGWACFVSIDLGERICRASDKNSKTGEERLEKVTENGVGVSTLASINLTVSEPKKIAKFSVFNLQLSYSVFSTAS